MIPHLPFLMGLASTALDFAKEIGKDVAEDVKKKAVESIIAKVIGDTALDMEAIETELKQAQLLKASYSTGFEESEMDEVMKRMTTVLALLFGDEAVKYYVSSIRNSNQRGVDLIIEQGVKNQVDTYTKLLVIMLLTNKVTSQDESVELRDAFHGAQAVMRIRAGGEWAWFDVDDFKAYAKGVRGAYVGPEGGFVDIFTELFESTLAQAAKVLPNPDFVKTKDDYQRLKGLQMREQGVLGLSLLTDTKTFKKIVL